LFRQAGLRRRAVKNPLVNVANLLELSSFIAKGQGMITLPTGQST